MERPDYATSEASVPEFARTHPRVWVVVFPNFAPEPATVALLRALKPAYRVAEAKKFRMVTIERLEALATGG